MDYNLTGRLRLGMPTFLRLRCAMEALLGYAVPMLGHFLTNSEPSVTAWRWLLGWFREKWDLPWEWYTEMSVGLHRLAIHHTSTGHIQIYDDI